MDDLHDHGAQAGPAGWRPSPLSHRPDRAALVVEGRRRVLRELPEIERALHGIGWSFDAATASNDQEAERLAGEALARGEGFVVAVGSDRHASAVANAMVRDDAPVNPEAVLGILAANTGGDVVRSFGLSQDPAEAVARLAVGNVYEIDVGKATVTTSSGERSRYFLNMAKAGVSGTASARAAALPRFLGRGGAFLGFWMAVAGFRRPRVRLQGDHRELEETVNNLIVANLQFSGGGMLVSPRSWPEDGYLDLQVFTGPTSEAFTLLPKMFKGEHLPHPHVVELRSKTLRVESDRPLWVEADGVPLGRTPAMFQAVPRVLRLKV